MPECCLNIAIVIAIIICIFWYAPRPAIGGYWATLDGHTVAVNFPAGSNSFTATGYAEKQKGRVYARHIITVTDGEGVRHWGVLLPDSRVIVWAGMPNWYRQGAM
jgi:hypothetical protein